MVFQDANQSNTYWCYGKLPKHQRVYTAAGTDYWRVWRKAYITT